MANTYGKNIQFTRLIKTEGRLREFNFRRSGGPEQDFFSVDVNDDRGVRIAFLMDKDGGKWGLREQIKPLPQWILNIADQFHELIEEGLRVP